MPTFRNPTNQIINYEANGKIYGFLPHKDAPIAEWIPYQELGLELVNENYPKVPSSILVSGRFKFSKGLERKFVIPHCDDYTVDISVKSGTLKLFIGNASLGVEISGRYTTSLHWGHAPYIRLKGLDTLNEALIHAEVERLMS